MKHRVAWVRRALVLIAAPGVALLAAPNPTQAAECRKHQIRPGTEGLSRLDGNPTDTELMRAAASLIRHRFGLPLPAPVTAYMCDGEAAILDEISRIERSDRAWFPASVWQAAGVTTRAGILLREDLLRAMTRADRAGTIAHELAHVSQRTLAGGRQASTPLWILEGHAQWVAFQVLQGLGYRTYEESRILVLRWVIDSKRQRKKIPDLRTVVSTRHWQENDAWVETYGQSFLAVDWLVERYGSETFVEFFRRLSSGMDPKGQWGQVFPISYDYFVDEFAFYLNRMGP